MEERLKTSPAFEKILAPSTPHPEVGVGGDTGGRLDVAVVFTSLAATIAALRSAGVLARRLNVRITLLVPQVVPYPAPLDSPPVLVDFSEKRFRALAAEAPVETHVRIYLCRDRLEALTTALRPQSLVVVGGRRRWWLTSERRLARQLRRAGHEVVYTEME